MRRALNCDWQVLVKETVKPTILLRICSLLTLLHAVMHTAGVLSSPKHGPEEIAVIQTMKSHFFEVYGSTRSYWDFLLGYGLFLTTGLLLQAVFLWQLSTLSRANPDWTKSVVALFFLNCVVMAVLSWRYFFIGPALIQFSVAACLALAFATA